MYVYGDSFAAPSTLTQTIWVKILADSLNLKLVNNAVRGSSTEYSFLKFIKDLQSNTFKPGDAIVFVISGPGRLHFNYQLFRDPSTASKFLGEVDVTDPANVWYKQNKNNIDWYIKNYNQEINQINHASYIHVLKSFAEENANIPVIVLQNPRINNDLQPKITPENFFLPTVSLLEVSNNEAVSGDANFEDWTEYTDIDCRLNHLTNPNHIILADAVKQTFINKTIDFWNYDLFQKSIIKKVTSLEEYEHFVKQGVIFRSPRIEQSLSKKVSGNNQWINIFLERRT